MEVTAATVGTFDGVHAGHRAILEHLSATAKRRGQKAVAFVLDPHPLALVAPDRAPRLLTTAAERCALITRNFPDVEARVLTFTDELRRLTAAQFMEMLRGCARVHTVVMGYDNTFGSDRLKTAAEYEQVGRGIGMTVESVAEVDVDGHAVSSSAVRRAVAAGEISLANRLLGRPHAVTGIVVHGRHMGTGLGFPTANLEVPPYMAIPGAGVYAAYAGVDGKMYPAMVNVGTAPTVTEGTKTTVEAHIIDFQGDIYGKEVRLSFLQRLRGEQRFASVEVLRKQLGCDRAAVLTLIKHK